MIKQCAISFCFQVLFGTDYPFLLGDLEGGKWLRESSKFTISQKEKIFAKNMHEFLGIS